mmetsp:Transcript_19438/g.36754  ORF Transcript_19438/g.36754 Transcript_19438/m.36754 type:complete len:551 (-) Transcript_19438:42-1694(-)
MATHHHSYDEALEALMGPDHQAKTPEEVKAASLRRTRTISDMGEYWKRIQQPEGNATNLQLPVRRVIHVAGTKGKGSTSIMCEAILRHRYGMNTGLFTSPHLMDVRERIRINGRPVSRHVFAQAYWEVRTRLEEGSKTKSDYDSTLPVLPGYFRMLTLLGLFIFGHHAEPAIDVIILEVGMGGRYDATNVLSLTDYQTAAGVTLLDYDHVRVLGNRIEQIAWEKAGVFQIVKGQTGQSSLRPFSEGWDPNQHKEKIARSSSSSSEPVSNRRTFYALDSNTESAVQVLQTCAFVEGEGARLVLVGSKHPDYAVPDHVSLGLAGRHQRENAALAVALTRELYHVCGASFTDKGTEAMYTGLTQVSWPARCQTVVHGTHTFRLDGAHTIQSLQAGLEWFQGARDTKRPAVLFFNCSHERNPVELIRLLCETGFDQVYFCRSDSSRPSMVAKKGARDFMEENSIPVVEEYLPKTTETWQQTLMAIWKHVDTKNVPAACDVSASEAIASISNDPFEIFVTGSLYLVGSVLSVIDWSEQEAEGRLNLGANKRHRIG